MRTFLLRALVLLLIALATESVRSDEKVPQVSELPEESHHETAHATAVAPGDGEKPNKEASLVQFGTGFGIGDALGFNPPSPPAMPPAVPMEMPLEASPDEMMPPVADTPPAPTPHPSEVWEDTPLPDIQPMVMMPGETMPYGYMPRGTIDGETMPPPVMATEENEEASKGSAAAKTASMPPLAEDEDDETEEANLFERARASASIPAPERTLPYDVVKPVKRRVEKTPSHSKQIVRGENIWDINMEEDQPHWQPEDTIQKRLIAGMPKVPVHKLDHRSVNKQSLPRKFGRHIQAFFQHIYHSAHGVVWGEWSPKWAKYRTGIFSVIFALSVAILPVLAMLFVTLSRFMTSKLPTFEGKLGKQAGASSTHGQDAEKGQPFVPDPALTDTMFYTSRMFPVD